MNIRRHLSPHQSGLYPDNNSQTTREQTNEVKWSGVVNGFGIKESQDLEWDKSLSVNINNV